MIHRIKPLIDEEYLNLLCSNFSKRESFNLNKYYYNSKREYYFDSATSGLLFLLKSLNAFNGDEILISDYNCKSILMPIKKLGLKPIFYDLNHDFQLNHNDIFNLINNKTRYIIFPHLFGFDLELKNLAKYIKNNWPKIIIIEDSAHSFCDFDNAAIGNVGDYTLLSIGVDKPISYGKAGIIVCNNSKYLELLDKNYNSMNKMKIGLTYKNILNPFIINELINSNYKNSINLDFISSTMIFPCNYSKKTMEKLHNNSFELLFDDFNCPNHIKIKILSIKNKLLDKLLDRAYIRASDLQVDLIKKISYQLLLKANGIRSTNFRKIRDGIKATDCYSYKKVFPSIRYPLQIFDEKRRAKIIKNFHSRNIEIANYCWPKFLSEITGTSRKHSHECINPKNIINLPTYFGANDRTIDIVIDSINDQ